MTDLLTNWAGNVRFSAERLRRPGSVPELQRLVCASKRARALGTGHSFSWIADTPGDLYSVAGLPMAFDLDTARATVRVSAGFTYAALARRLHERGFALRNLGSLPHIGVAGACATATHGSGDAVGNLATAVSALEMVTASGDVVMMSREADGEEFSGAASRSGLSASSPACRWTSSRPSRCASMSTTTFSVSRSMTTSRPSSPPLTA